MRKILIFTLLISVLLLLSGCQQQTTSTGSYYKYTGLKAISAKFLEGSPTSSEIDTYQKGENIDIIIELINHLPEEVEVGQAKVRLTGDAAITTFFTGAQEKTNPRLLSINTDTGVATPEEVETGPIRFVGDLTTKISKKITGQYCYSIPVKIKANLFYTNKELEIGTNLPAGSNPPSSVQIVELQQQTVNIGTDGKGELRFKVTIKNIGQGTIIPGLSDCFKYRETTAREELKLKAAAGYPITCDDEIKLSRTDKSKVVDCKVTGIDMANLGPDASELTLTLSDFAYEEDLDPVTIWLEP
ncbi:MAG: hypothetical protein V1914_02510 [archaeon]